MWTFELYRILTAQRIAQALLEAEQSRLAAKVADRSDPREAVPVHPRVVRDQRPGRRACPPTSRPGGG
jgi:hypothetical protein